MKKAATETYNLPGGAKRSEKAPPYHMVPPEGARRVALGFALGAEKYGEENWKRSLISEGDAAIFCREAYNHGEEHMAKMRSGEDPSDDHLGAIGWMVSVLAYAEAKFGKSWRELRHVAR